MKLTNEDIKQFLREGSFRESTKSYYGYLLGKFKRAGGELTEDSVREYVTGYKREGSSNTVLEVIKSLSKWKHAKIPPIGDENNMLRFELERIIKGVKGMKTVTRLERRELTDRGVEIAFNSLVGLGFSGLWCLAWFGCRPGELVELTLELINKKPDRYLPEDLAKALRPGDYCVKFLTEKTIVERALFMDEFTKGHLERFIRSGRGYSFLRRECVDLREKVGEKLTPKWFRSTFITKMQRRLLLSLEEPSGIGMVKLDLLVKVMAGHTVKRDITGIYTDYGQDIKRAMTELHFLKPLERDLGGKA